MYYSKSTNGFYDRAVHGDNIPTDAVEITSEYRWELINGQSSGKQITGDENGYPILIDPPEQPPQVPQTVSRFQAKAALHHAGLLPQVQEYINNSDDVLTQLAWDEASFHRNSNMVATIGAELGLTEAAIDDLFITAASINV